MSDKMEHLGKFAKHFVSDVRGGDSIKSKKKKLLHKASPIGKLQRSNIKKANYLKELDKDY